MILSQNPKTGWWTDHGYYRLCNLHPEGSCEDRGCAIHNHPSGHPLKDAPLNWREDRGILERLCEHGVGHPDADAAEYQRYIGRDYENVHGCDGCCHE